MKKVSTPESAAPSSASEPGENDELGSEEERDAFEDAIGRVPELRDGLGEVLRLLRRPARDGDGLLLRERVVQIGTDALERRGPGGQRIRLATVQHVAHREAELIEIILNAQQLQRFVSSVAMTGK